MPRIVVLGAEERVTRKELQTAAAIKKRNRTYRTNGAYRTDKKMGEAGLLERYITTPAGRAMIEIYDKEPLSRA